MPQGLDLMSLSELVPAIPFFIIGFIVTAVGSVLLASSPIVLISSLGEVNEEDLHHERRKSAFALMVFVSVLCLAGGWWSITQSADILGAFSL
jgi:hypothetical protein